MDDDVVRPRASSFGRRDLLKLGAGAVLTSIATEQVSSQQGGRGPRRPTPAPGSPRPAGELRPHTSPGYKNDYNRLGGNGPMDDTTRKIVKFVREFSEADLTPAVTAAVNRTMVDSMAALISGFEGEACRVAARLARLSPPGELKSTVLRSAAGGHRRRQSPALSRLAGDNDRSGDERHCPADAGESDAGRRSGGDSSPAGRDASRPQFQAAHHRRQDED